MCRSPPHHRLDRKSALLKSHTVLAGGFDKELIRRLGGERTVVADNLHVDAIRQEATGFLPLHVVFARVLGETPLLRLDNLLATRELELRAAERLDGLVGVHILGADGQHDLTDGHPRGNTLRLTVRTTHTRLQAIRTSARKHLVDTQNVERVQAHAKVETFLTSLGHHVLVRGNTAGFHSLGADLFLFETTNRE